MEKNSEKEERSNESQCNAIIAYLKKGNKITPMDALRMFGCFRLSARIADIRKRGYVISSELVMTEKGKRVARYTMVNFNNSKQ